MNKKEMPSGRLNGGVSRRRFLWGGGAACAAAAGFWAAPPKVGAAGSGRKMRLRVVYALHALKQPKPDWPNLGFDFAPVMERINPALTNAFPDLEFLPVTASGPVQANNILLRDVFSSIDG